jgi:hypothetical protein
MIVGLPDSYIQAEANSQVDIAEDHGIKLQRGQMVARGGRHGLKVRTKLANIHLQPKSVALVESKSGQSEKITVLEDNSAQGVAVQAGGQTYGVKAGEGLLLSAVIEAKANRRHTHQAVVSNYPVDVLRVAVHLPELLEYNVLFQCTPHIFRNKLEKKPGPQRGLAAGPIRTSWNPNVQPCTGCLKSTVAQSPDTSEPVPLLTGQVQTWNVIHDRPQQKLKPSVQATTAAMPHQFHIAPGSQVLPVGANHYKFDRGSIMVKANSPVRFDTPNCSVTAQTDSAVIITAAEGVTRVLDLVDRKRDTTVNIGKFVATLRPGLETSVVTSPQTSTNGEALVWSDGLARRDVRTIFFNDKFSVVESEFSYLSAMGRHPLLREARASKSQADKKLFAQIMKNAASILMAVDRQKGPYSVPERSTQTASSKPEGTQ